MVIPEAEAAYCARGSSFGGVVCYSGGVYNYLIVCSSIFFSSEMADSISDSPSESPSSSKSSSST